METIETPAAQAFLSDVFYLVSIDCELSLQAIYAKVQFSQE